MKIHLLPLFLVLASLSLLRADETRVIFAPGVQGWDKQIFPNGQNQPDVSFAAGPDGVEISVQAGGASSFPGIRVQPESPWDISAFGRVDATVGNTSGNTSGKAMRVSVRVDDSAGETATGSRVIQPGETATIPVFLDYSGKSKLKSTAIKSFIVFGSKGREAQTFRVDRVVAAGPPGEKPPVDPKTQAVRPPNGVMLGEGAKTEGARQIQPVGSGKGSLENGALRVDASGTKDGVTFKPAVGLWNLNNFIQARVQVKNTGAEAVSPSIRLESASGPGSVVKAPAPIPPGDTTEIIVPFAAAIPWEGPDDPDVANEPLKKNFKGKPGTGTDFVSHKVTGVTILGDDAPGTRSFTVTRISAENITPDLPEWLGQRPPVEGEWTKTFEDNFDGSALDQTRWNIYGPNFWDKRTHFSKDNVIVKDGTLSLRVEKKTGHHNDDPNARATDYATGFADTYGKWVQRYGYFEARVKLPTAPCMWPAFWLMPDRGLGNGDQGRRQSTRFGGMEFDIIEQLSIYGSQRLNFAMHWDGYGTGHKATGTGSIYVPADKDGFITVGLLWLPGEAVLYGNGREVARWKNDRISNVASNILLDHVTGGWEVETLDDSQLPADFVLDYVRVWQRKDLASDVDGPKPNKGEPAAPKE